MILLLRCDTGISTDLISCILLVADYKSTSGDYITLPLSRGPIGVLDPVFEFHFVPYFIAVVAQPDLSMHIQPRS